MKPIFSKQEVQQIVRGHVSPFWLYRKTRSVSWVIGMMCFAIVCAAYILMQSDDEQEALQEAAYAHDMQLVELHKTTYRVAD